MKKIAVALSVWLMFFSVVCCPIASFGQDNQVKEQPKEQTKDQPQEKSAEPSQQEMQDVFSAMGPAMGSMMEGMMSSMFSVLAKPEIAEQLATFTKNYYDALIKKGFSKEEAMRIIISVGMPHMNK